MQRRQDDQDQPLRNRRQGQSRRYDYDENFDRDVDDDSRSMRRQEQYGSQGQYGGSRYGSQGQQYGSMDEDQRTSSRGRVMGPMEDSRRMSPNWERSREPYRDPHRDLDQDNFEYDYRTRGSSFDEPTERDGQRVDQRESQRASPYYSQGDRRIATLGERERYGGNYRGIKRRGYYENDDDGQDEPYRGHQNHMGRNRNRYQDEYD